MDKSAKRWAMLAGAAIAVSFLRSDRPAPTGVVADHPLDETTPPRGRNATHPAQIPAYGWRLIAMRSMGAVMEHRVLAVAAGVTFFILLALVPAISAFVSFYGLFSDPLTIADHLAVLETILPADALSVVTDQVRRISSGSTATMTFASLASVLIAVWSANGGTKAMIEALNVAYDEREKRSFVWLNIVSLAMTAGMAALIVGMFVLVAVIPAVVSHLPIGVGAETTVLLARWPAIFIVMLAVLAGFYRFGPSREAARWRWISPGAVVAAVGLVVFSMLFSFYAGSFANFNETYGSLGALMGLLMWLWLGCVIVLVGAELNAEAEKQTNRDTTTGRPRPMGKRDARAADVVAY